MIEFNKLIKVSFAKLADGTSNSGKPKSPIETKSHPDNGNWNKLQVNLNEAKSGCLFRWDHDYWTELGRIPKNQLGKECPWWTQAPEFKILFGLAAEIPGKLTTMNRDGKAELAKQLIAAGNRAVERGRVKEGGLISTLRVEEKKIKEQLDRVRAQEAAAGGCCNIL